MVKAREIQPLTDFLYRIQIPMFPVYLFTTRTTVLVDSGVSTGAPQLRSVLTCLLGERPLDTLLLTHSHWDHVGAAFDLQKQFGFSVQASRRAVELLEKPKVRDFAYHLNSDHAIQTGQPPPEAFQALCGLTPLSEGDRIPLDEGRWLDVLETPGHTRCSLSYFLQPEGFLFPGDAAGVMERDGSIKPLFLSSYSDYERSLEKLLKLGARAICFPHNRVLKGEIKANEYLARSLRKTRRVRDTIEKQLDLLGDINAVAERLLENEFPKPTVMGPREALIINLRAMTLAVRRELSSTAGNP